MRRVYLLVIAMAATLVPLQAQRGASVFLRTPGNFGGGGLAFGGLVGRPGISGYGYGGNGYGGYGYGGSSFLYGNRGRVPFAGNQGYLGYANSNVYGSSYGGYNNMNNMLPLYGTAGYWLWSRMGNMAAGTQQPSGPSFANPTAIAAPEPIAAAIVAPQTPAGEDWTEVRSRFASVSAKLQSARTSVAEMRARLAAMGQAPRAELTSRLALAETALSEASKAIEARSLDNAQSSLQRADYVVAQVLKEFGR